MQFKRLKLTAVSSLIISVALSWGSYAQAYVNSHHHRHYYHHEAYSGRPLIVASHHRYYSPAQATNDPWRGPVPIITGPNYVAATIVSLPFRAANSIFPAYGDPATNPLILVGAPIHVAAQVAEFPFYAVGTVFGAPPALVY